MYSLMSGMGGHFGQFAGLSPPDLLEPPELPEPPLGLQRFAGFGLHEGGGTGHSFFTGGHEAGFFGGTGQPAFAIVMDESGFVFGAAGETVLRASTP